MFPKLELSPKFPVTYTLTIFQKKEIRIVTQQLEENEYKRMRRKLFDEFSLIDISFTDDKILLKTWQWLNVNLSAFDRTNGLRKQTVGRTDICINNIKIDYGSTFPLQFRSARLG